MTSVLRIVFLAENCVFIINHCVYWFHHSLYDHLLQLLPFYVSGELLQNLIPSVIKIYFITTISVVLVFHKINHGLQNLN